MHLIAKRRGLGVVYSSTVRPGYSANILPPYGVISRGVISPVLARAFHLTPAPVSPTIPETPTTPTTPAATPVSAPTPPAAAIGATSQDSAGNIYVNTPAGWQLTTPAVSGSVPSVASAAATPAASTIGFPTNAVVGQTYTDSLGNVYTYGSTGWTLTTPAGSATSWLTEETVLAGFPNWGVLAVAGAGVFLLMKMMGKR